MAIGRADLKKALQQLERGDWQAAHVIVQADEESRLACWAHGIAHLMEGDAANARYWYRAAERNFPAQPSIEAEIAALKSEIER
jgi:hypothetical protein